MFEKIEKDCKNKTGLNTKTTKFVAFIMVLFTFTMCKTETEELITEKKIDKYVNYNVYNKTNEDVSAIINTWQAYLESETLVSFDHEYWISPSHQNCPSCIMRVMPLKDFKSRGVQNTIIGVHPVEDNLWELTSMFASVSVKDGKIMPHCMLTVYAKHIDGAYKFMNKTDYVIKDLNKEEVGNITYYFDCHHEFDRNRANQMAAFNKSLSDFFETSEISFDYFICKDWKTASKVMGYDFEQFMYVHNQIGGLTEVFNKIIYAGNNSEYYPHEVVHLYTKELFNHSYHSWIDEGLATVLGGSKGQELEWHLCELKDFLEENEDFELNDISKLYTVPNDKYTTGFKYVIGGLLVKEIYDKEGVTGIREILQYGRTNEDFYRLLEEKFNVPKSDFGDYIRNKLKKI